MKSEKDYYQLLGIPRNASFDDIKKAYRLYAAKFHPDKHDGDEFFVERFKEVSEAYDTLSDTEKRVRYDIKKFGRSRALIKADAQRVDDTGAIEKSKPKKEFRIDLSHIHIYLTLIYLINLVAWVMMKRMHDQSSIGGHIWSLFLCGVSTLLMWLFITRLIELRNPEYKDSRIFLVGYILLALLAGAIPLATNWIS